MKRFDLRGRFSYWADVVSSAANNISTNKLRSALTIAIVALGITCLVGTQTATDCLASLLSGAFGTSAERISIASAKSATGSRAGKVSPKISYLQATQFASSYGDARQISVYTYVPAPYGVQYAGGRLGPQTTVVACDGDWLACNGLTVGHGRGTGGVFSPGECIVGRSVASRLGGTSKRENGPAQEPEPGQQALGKQLYIGGKSYCVAGVLQQQSSLLGAIADNSIFIPVKGAPTAAGGYSIDFTVGKEQANGVAAGRASSLMRRIRRLRPSSEPDFEITEGSAAEKEIEKLAGSLSGIAFIIGLLTLAGAVVALTNIMLICVAERTREVGIKRALGATKADIRSAYIIEAVIICEAGCIIGTLLGILCGNALGLYLHTGSSIPWDWILVSQAISIAAGIAACALPARRAAAMDPVEALRCE